MLELSYHEANFKSKVNPLVTSLIMFILAIKSQWFSFTKELSHLCKTRICLHFIPEKEAIHINKWIQRADGTIVSHFCMKHVSMCI
jgi:hypothetical protein